MGAWTELAAPHRHTGQGNVDTKDEEVWRRLVVMEQESECGTEGQEQGRGWTRSCVGT